MEFLADLASNDIRVDNKNFFGKAILALPKSDQYNVIRSNLIKNTDESYRFCDLLSLCEICGCSYSDIPKNHSLAPSKKLNRFLRRIRKKSNDEYGTKYQKESLRKLIKYSTSQYLWRICRFCNLKRKRKIDKPVGCKTMIEPQEETKKRKRSKKDKYAGLKENVVSSVKNNESFTPKRRKLNDSVIILDTPEQKLPQEITKPENVIAEIDKALIFIDKIPTYIENETPLKKVKVIDIIDPKPPKLFKIDDNVVSLDTPKKGATKKSKKNNKCATIIKVRTNKKKGLKNKKDNAPLTDTVNKKSVNIKKKNDKSVKKKGLIEKYQNSPNKVLNKKLNSLQKLLQSDNEMNKSNSNLEQFLEKVS